MHYLIFDNSIIAAAKTLRSLWEALEQSKQYKDFEGFPKSMSAAMVRTANGLTYSKGGKIAFEVSHKVFNGYKVPVTIQRFETPKNYTTDQHNTYE